LILSLLKYPTELWSKQIVKIVSLTLFFSKLLLIVFSKGSAGERTMENSEASLECLGTFHKLNFSSQLGLRTIDFLGFVWLPRKKPKPLFNILWLWKNKICRWFYWENEIGSTMRVCLRSIWFWRREIEAQTWLE